MSFPSVQPAPVYTPVASSMPQQTAYIQQGRCGNCGVTLNPYPQTQLNQGDSGQYQMSAQGNIQSSGGTLQGSHQFAQASGQSYVGGQGGQQQVETTLGQVQSSQQSVIEASEAPSGEAAPATADTGKPGFDFAAFFSPLNKNEREERARNAAKADTGPHVQSEQSQIGQAQAPAGQTQAEQAQAEQAQVQAGQTPAGQTPAGQTQAGQTQTGQTQAGQTQAGQTQAGQTQAGQAQAGQTSAGQAQAGQTSPGQIQAGYSQSQTTGQIHGGGAGYSQGGQLQSSHTQSGYTGPVQSGQVPSGASSGQSGQLSSSGYTQSGQTQQPDTGAPHLAVQQHASAPAGGQLQSHSSQQRSMMAAQSQASSVPYQALAGLSTQKMHVALAEMDHEISELTTSTVDQVRLAYKQTTALAAQQRAFLQGRGALPKEACASCGHFEAAKQPFSSSGANVQQKQSDTTKKSS